MSFHRICSSLPARQLILALGLLSCFGCTTIRLPSPPAAENHLEAIFRNYFEAYLKLFPTFASEIGDHRYDDQLENGISEEHLVAQAELARRTLDDLQQIDVEHIDSQRRLFYDTLRLNLNDTLEGLEFPQHLLPIRQLASLAVEFPLLASPGGIQPFRTVADYDKFLRRIKAFDGWIDTAIANMRRGIVAGIVQPRPVIERALPQLEAMIVTEPRSSLFFRPILQLPENFSASDRARLADAYLQAISQIIVPGYRRLSEFLRNEYLPKSRSTVAWSALPNGAAWYDYLVKNQTTSELTPEEIFALGEQEIVRIKREIERWRNAAAFQSVTTDSAQPRREYSAGNFSSRAELIGGYEAIGRKITPNLTKLFGRMPQSPFEVRTIEEYREQSAPSQYWSAGPDGSRPGIFYVNARGIETNPRRASESLFLHEAIPGHHWQISLQRERSDMPGFQRFADYTAFTEGWALYAESLGGELGLYADTEQYLSRLNSELFRAVRLVVDVGLHRKNWSRQQAIDFIIGTAGGSESGASTEVDRYIAVPAQALGYKIGQLKISAIRAKAEKWLGNRFDIRAFHDELLKDGALPLTILEVKMDHWIEQAGH